MKTKPETIDEVCKQPEGSFKKFVEKKEAHLRDLEQKRRTMKKNFLTWWPLTCCSLLLILDICLTIQLQSLREKLDHAHEVIATLSRP